MCQVLLYRIILKKLISTHTLTWSVTLIVRVLSISFDNFNSHAHVERDIFCGTLMKLNFISTHTLTWSVTIADRVRTEV